MSRNQVVESSDDGWSLAVRETGLWLGYFTSISLTFTKLLPRCAIYVFLQLLTFRRILIVCVYCGHGNSNDFSYSSDCCKQYKLAKERL